MQRRRNACRGDGIGSSAARLDDALRQYLAEQGPEHVPLEDVAVLAGYLNRWAVLFTRYQHTAFDSWQLPDSSYTVEEVQAGVRLRRSHF